MLELVLGAILGVALFLIFFRFTIVGEGTAKAVVRLGGFKKVVMAWRDYELDKEWNVRPVAEIGKRFHLPGGLRFIGFWPIDSVYKYKFRWQGIEIVQGREKIEFREKILDYILVKPDVYWTKIEAAETAPPERIPLDIEFLITARVSNPYKALFIAPPNWLENVLSRLNGLFRDWVATKTLDDILAIRKEPKKIWEELGKSDLIQKTFKEEWGILIEENGIQIRDVKLPPAYAEAAARERQMELEAKGIAAETVGAVIEMMARARGKEPKEITEEIDKDPKMREEFLKLAQDLIVRKMGIEGGAYVDIRVIGAEGIERMLLNALAAWRRMPTGKVKTKKEKEEKLRFR
jgi:regulator of protease activity HflC (stomatin/prohibitin superfamily)